MFLPPLRLFILAADGLLSAFCFAGMNDAIWITHADECNIGKILVPPSHMQITTLDKDIKHASLRWAPPRVHWQLELIYHHHQSR